MKIKHFVNHKITNIAIYYIISASDDYAIKPAITKRKFFARIPAGIGENLRVKRDNGSTNQARGSNRRPFVSRYSIRLTKTSAVGT